jgi:hypothetical protein
VTPVALPLSNFKSPETAEVLQKITPDTINTRERRKTSQKNKFMEHLVKLRAAYGITR